MQFQILCVLLPTIAVHLPITIILILVWNYSITAVNYKSYPGCTRGPIPSGLFPEN